MKKHDAPPVSGEILVDAAVSPKRRMQVSAHGIVDAEYVVIGRSASSTADQAAAPDWLLPEDRNVPHGAPSQAGDSAADGLGMLRPDGESASAARSHTGFYALSAAAIATTFWFSGGYSLLWHGEPARHATPVSGISIVDVVSRVSEQPGGKRIILVNGYVRNHTENPAGVPPLAVKVSEQGGANRRYVFGMQNKVLGGGESYRFALRLDAPERPVDKLAVEFSRKHLD